MRGVRRSDTAPSRARLPSRRQEFKDGGYVGASGDPEGQHAAILTRPSVDPPVAVTGHDVAMQTLLWPFRAIYRGLVWLANSPRTLILSYLMLIVICGVLYHFFEPDASIGDAVWWAVVTASTVGYGDISPETWQARVLAALLISIMVLLVIPLITAHFASKLIVDTKRSATRAGRAQEQLRGYGVCWEMAEREGITVPDSASPPPAPSDR